MPKSNGRRGRSNNSNKAASAFPGVPGRTISESTPAWPQPVRAKPGANVLFIVLDDPISTPNLNQDYSETTILAGTSRNKRTEMVALCYTEAGKYKALPIDSRVILRLDDTSTTHQGPQEISSAKDVPEGALQLRFEFEPTGKPDVMKGKGAAGHGR
jgi:hypothetical protein